MKPLNIESLHANVLDWPDWSCRWVATTEGAVKCVPCTYGRYCPGAGTWVQLPCPRGTYRDTGFGSSLASCHQCPPYKACTSLGEISDGIEECEAGYYCVYGSASTTPSKTHILYDAKKAGPCPPGLYCEQGAPPKPCPRGTLGLDEKQASMNDCDDCPAGNTQSAVRSSAKEGHASSQILFNPEAPL